MISPVTLCGRGRLPPAQWMETLRAIRDAAREADIDYAVVGSLGIALSAGLEFIPTKRLEPAGIDAIRDLDIFLLGDDDRRARFRYAFVDREAAGFPRVDLVPVYHDHIGFEGDHALLRFREIVVSMDASVFRPVAVKVGDLTLPILHPRTHIHMMGHNFLLPAKIRRNIRCLSKAVRGPLCFPLCSEKVFRSFHHFKREKLRAHPVRHRMWSFRLALYDWEAEGHASQLVNIKRYLRQRHPTVAALLRRLF